jgi:ATP-dependent exoDNAse (exonuclease V) beta subunit
MEAKNFTVYKSSAGSGKTYTIVKEYLKLALSSKSPKRFRQILAMTFTNKAANEMKERVLTGLRNLALDPADPQFEEKADLQLFRSIQEELGIEEKDLRERADLALKNVLHNYADLSICTIDKFVHRVVRTFAKDLRIPMDFDIEIEEDNLLRKAIDQLISQVGRNEELTQLLVEFVEAKTEDEKSWDIKNDIYDFARNLSKEESQQHVKQLSKLSIDDFNSIKNELGKKVAIFEAQIINLGKEGFQLITNEGIDHSAFYQSRSGISQYFEKLSKGQMDVLSKPNKNVHKTVIDDKWYASFADEFTTQKIDNIKGRLAELFQEIQQYCEKEQKHYQLYKVIFQGIYNMALLNEIDKIISRLKDENELLLISDLNKKIALIIVDQPAPFIYERLGERYRNYLLDEFQDNSVMQWHNLLPLLENSLATDNFNIIVGDGKQAIYRWRNGEVEQFAKLPSIHGHNDNRVLLERQFLLERNYHEEVLGTNYRSQSEIIEFNNHFFEDLAKKMHPDYQNIYQSLHQQFLEDKQGGYVQVKALDHKTDDLKQDYLLATKAMIEEALEDGFKLSDIAILTRQNNSGSLIANYLINEGINVVSSESLLLNNSEHVQFLVSMLQYLKDNNDNIPKARIIHFLLQQKGEAHRFNEMVKNYSFQEKKETRYSVKIKLEQFLKDQGYQLHYGQLSQQPIYQTIEDLVGKFGFHKAANAYVQFFLDATYNYSKAKGNNLFDFLDWWESKKEKLSIKVPKAADAVQVMTIHKSKGLQFPIVISAFTNWSLDIGMGSLWLELNDEIGKMKVSLVPKRGKKNLEKTDYYHYIETEEAKTLLDNINLLYVAFTRPEERLYVVTDTNTRNTVAKEVLEWAAASENWNPETKTFIAGKRTAPKHTEEIDEDKIYELTSLQNEPWNSKLFISRQAPEMWDLENFDTAQQYGKLIHTALSRITESTDLDKALHNLEEEGLILSKEAPEIRKNLSELFAIPTVQQWFREGVKAKIEVDILAKNGKIYRPDRIVFDENKTVVIDFKTGLPKDNHQKQLNEYGKLIDQMGYSNVEKYLIYTDEKRVEQVF